MEQITPLLSEAEAQVPGARERLFSALYVELHGLAKRHLHAGGAPGGAGVSPTTLLHETYLGMMQGSAQFPDRARFMAYASRVMRGLIIDFARERCAQKRGGEFHITRLDDERAGQIPDESQQDELIRLSEELDALSQREPRLAEVVDLKYFCGFSLNDIAAMRGVAVRTVQRDWEKARLLLFQELTGTEKKPSV